MPLLLTGISHKTAPVELRERLAVTGGAEGSAVSELLLRLADHAPLAECAVIATCNRTEIYGLSESSDWQESLLAFFADHGGLPAARLQPHVYCFEGIPTARHLMRVACGLDSMILGEAQIQAQVKEALTRAQEVGTAGKTVDALFRAALSTGKRAREETEITRGAVSVSLAAVELARQIFGRLRDHRALVLGAGETGEQTARLLVDAGVDSRVRVCNRTLERAQSVAERFGGVACSLADLPEALAQVDIVISCTGAPHPILTADLLRPVLRRRRGRLLFIIDIAVPRDAEAEVGDLEDVFLYNIDDLQQVVGKNMSVRQSEVERVETIIEEEIVRFQGWLAGRSVAPTIGDLQRKAEAISQAEMARLGGRLSHLSERDREVIATLVHGVVNKMLRDPILHLREAAGSDNGHETVEVIRAAFALDEGTDSPPAALETEKASGKSATSFSVLSSEAGASSAAGGETP